MNIFLKRRGGPMDWKKNYSNGNFFSLLVITSHLANYLDSAQLNSTLLTDEKFINIFSLFFFLYRSVSRLRPSILTTSLRISFSFGFANNRTIERTNVVFSDNQTTRRRWRQQLPLVVVAEIIIMKSATAVVVVEQNDLYYDDRRAWLPPFFSTELKQMVVASKPASERASEQGCLVWNEQEQ